ncbi:hypothetical protein [Jeotgalibacillus marinus]|uniref:Permease n=1 Tax=Jeotgalibacillus marinus TaxID=86667 RepID=A0ABV3Q6J1_9BACL
MKKRFQVLIYIFMYGSIVAGAILGLYLVERVEGPGFVDYHLVIPMLVGIIGGAGVPFCISLWNKKRNKKVPEVDERVISLLRKYFLIVLYIVLIGSGFALVTLYSLGVHSIETGMLIAVLSGLYSLIGLGFLIIKRL